MNALRLVGKWLAGVAAAVSILGGHAAADTAVDTFGPGGTWSPTSLVNFGGTPLPPPAAAIRFTVPWPGIVRSVDLALASSAPGEKVVNIWSDGAAGISGPGAEPRFPLVGFTVPAVSTTPGVVRVTAEAVLTLQPGQTYWLIVRQIGSPTVNWFSGSTQGFWYLQNPFDGTWIATRSSMPAVRINLDAPGSCCSTSGNNVCAILTRPECDGFGGLYGGPATACTNVLCPVQAPVGACCINGGCQIMATPGCTFSGGVSLGIGAVCEPLLRGGRRINACCPADFNASGSASTQDLFDFLAVFFAGCV